MDNWTMNFKDLGTLKVGQVTKFTFNANKKLNITRVVPSCFCLTASYNEETNTINVKYTPTPIPVHLKAEGRYNSTKTILVYYQDGRTETLTFTAKIIKK